MRSRLVIFVFSLTACATVAPDEPGPLLAPLVDPGSAEERGILAFLNDASTTVGLLDDDVRLDRRAAHNLIEERARGPFESIDQVDAVPYVGSVALQKILTWALDNGWVDASGNDRDAAILALVNDPATDFTLLDIDVGLDRRAAQNIVDARPYVSIPQLDAVSYVGPRALDLLAAYALANGYGAEPSDPTAPCAIIGEVVEGPGNYNKAIEIYNCGTDALVLDQLGVCLVRNDDTSCSISKSAGSGLLPPGETHVGCRTQGGTFLDPYDQIRDTCAEELGSVATFNGDDRLMLFHDADADGNLGENETILDVFGEIARRPWGNPWADASFRRCDLTPHLGGAFDVEGTYLRAGRTDFSHLGVPPNDDCGSAMAAEGERCLRADACVDGLRCEGIPHDGSSPYGRCIDPAPAAGEGDTCDRWSPCDGGLVCAGWTLWGEGHCVPQWMAGRWTRSDGRTIYDPGASGLRSEIIVEGLASVPVDIEVTAHIEHPRLTDLRVTLIDPNGDSAVLWDRSAELEEWSRSFVTTGISRDDQVNGRWTLHLQDLVTGETGVLDQWTLFIVSRWD